MRNKLLLLVFGFLLWYNSYAQLYVLDITSRNGEIKSENTYSAEHIMRTVGVPFKTTDDIDVGLSGKFVLISSSIETTTFTSAEISKITNYVQNGGVVISTNVKEPSLYAAFGVSGYSYKTDRFFLKWDTTSSSNLFKWMNHPNEVTLRLGDSTVYPAIYGTRGYSLSTANRLAQFEDGSAAFTCNQHGNGFAYLLGIPLKEIIKRSQIGRDYKANYVYSNNIEPGADALILFFRQIISKHIPYSVFKYTVPENAESTLIITHDIDAETSMDLQEDYARYEKQNNLAATYLITTHYIDDALAGDYYTHNKEKIKTVKNLGHNIESHSVGHFPDFDNENIVPEGGPINPESYSPYFKYYSENASVYGELAVSKDLLDQDIQVNVKIFRPGYLAFHQKLINVLLQTGYDYSSSRSANDVGTSYPYLGTLDQVMEGDVTRILEIPNLISDVFMSDPITYENYEDKVDKWIEVSQEQKNNHTPIVWLLHPTRRYKLDAQDQFLKGLPEGISTKTLLEYAQFWQERDSLDYTTSVVDSIMTITIKNQQLPLDSNLSLVIDNGQKLKEIVVKDESGNTLNLLQENWEDSSVIVFSRPFVPIKITSPPIITFVENFSLDVYPNPTSDIVYIDLDLDYTYYCEGELFNAIGESVMKLLPGTELPMSPYSFKIDISTLPAGVYIANMVIGEEKYHIKIVKAE